MIDTEVLVKYQFPIRKLEGALNHNGQRKNTFSWASFKPSSSDTPEEREKKISQCAEKMVAVAGKELLKITSLTDLCRRYCRKADEKNKRKKRGLPVEKVALHERSGLDLLSRGPTIDRKSSRAEIEARKDAILRTRWCLEDYSALDRELARLLRDLRNAQASRGQASD